ncbi:MAG: PIG-L family deacetylase [Firmicutes bacterium]|nr:PIG-L family deacetylase [Bacillota bacterium]
MDRKYKILLSAAGTLVAAGGAYVLWQARKLSPPKINDAQEAGRIILQGGQRVLVFTAHPDDVELLAGGTLRRLHQLGSPITVVDATDGEKGVNMQNLAPRRQREQKLASSILGYDDIKFLHFPDMELKDQDKLLARVKSIWEEENPQLVFAFDPLHYHPWLRHPDHIALGEAVVHAAGELDSDAMICLYGSAKASQLVDISGVINIKVRAVCSHRSQLRGGIRMTKMLVRRLARTTAFGSPFRYAEAFRSLHNIHTFVPPTAEEQAES